MIGKTALASAQQGVYIDCILDPENLRYNNPKAISIPDGIEPGTVVAATIKVLEQHPALFSHFEEQEGEPVQVYADGCHTEVKLTKTDDEGVEAEKLPFNKAFNIGKGPLYKTNCIKVRGRIPERTGL